MSQADSTDLRQRVWENWQTWWCRLQWPHAKETRSTPLHVQLRSVEASGVCRLGLCMLPACHREGDSRFARLAYQAVSSSPDITC